MINWPAVINYKGEDELTYVSSQSEWDGDADLHYFAYEAEDRLIDSYGQVFSLSDHNGSSVNPKHTNESLELQALIELAQKHAVSLGECCSAKMFFSSVSDVINAIGQFEDR